MITPEHLEIVERSIATRIGTAVSGFEVNSSPVLFGGVEDYWAVVDAKVTRKLIETTPVKLITMNWVDFADDTEQGSDHSPQVRFRYAIDVFRQYSYLRVDETETPDDFDKKQLASYREYLSAVLSLKAAFQGKRNIAGLDAAVYAIRQTRSLEMQSEDEDREECRYVRGVFGHQSRMYVPVELMLVQC